ncbi:hypothetical protein GCM10023067_55470 [Aminobacter aganoensis]
MAGAQKAVQIVHIHAKQTYIVEARYREFWRPANQRNEGSASQTCESLPKMTDPERVGSGP